MSFLTKYSEIVASVPREMLLTYQKNLDFSPFEIDILVDARNLEEYEKNQEEQGKIIRFFGRLTLFWVSVFVVMILLMVAGYINIFDKVIGSVLSNFLLSSYFVCSLIWFSSQFKIKNKLPPNLASRIRANILFLEQNIRVVIGRPLAFGEKLSLESVRLQSFSLVTRDFPGSKYKFEYQIATAGLFGIEIDKEEITSRLKRPTSSTVKKVTKYGDDYDSCCDCLECS